MRNQKFLEKLILGLSLPATVLFAAACKPKEDPAYEAKLMSEGTQALYASRDPKAAAADFTLVLKMNPNHYGANFQMARALDAEGKRDEARPYWEKTYALAAQIKDAATLHVVQERLAQPAGDSPGAAAPASAPDKATELMNAGLAAFYQRHDIPAAIADYQNVLKINPNHYGANFQLAYALENAKRHKEAVPYWEKVLRIANEIRDVPTATAARRYLAKPE